MHNHDECGSELARGTDLSFTRTNQDRASQALRWKIDSKRMSLLSAAPLAQLLVQSGRAIDLLTARMAEQNKCQLGSHQSIGARVVTFLCL